MTCADLCDSGSPLSCHHLIFVAGKQYRHGRADGGEHIGAKAGVLFLLGPSESDDAAAGHCQNEPDYGGKKIEFL